MADTSSLRLSLITLWAASCFSVLQLEALPPWLARSWCSTHAMCAHVLLNRQVEWAIVPYSPFPLPVTSKCPTRQQAPSWRGAADALGSLIAAIALGALLTSVGHAERPRRVGLGVSGQH